MPSCYQTFDQAWSDWLRAGPRTVTPYKLGLAAMYFDAGQHGRSFESVEQLHPLDPPMCRWFFEAGHGSVTCP